MRDVLNRWAGVATGLILGAHAAAAPTSAPYPVAGSDAAAVASSQLVGKKATASSGNDSIEIRDARDQLVRTIARAEIEALAPWMSLDTSHDGPTALAWSDSGRLLFIAVYDDTTPGDGMPSDAILRYDAASDTLGLFARLELASSTTEAASLALAHFRGRLYAGSTDGTVTAFRAERNDLTGTIDHIATPPGAGPVRGLAVDRVAELIFASNDAGVHSASLAGAPLAFSQLGAFSSGYALAFSTHYGGAGDEGLYVFQARFGSASRIYHVPIDQARSQAAFAPVEYAIVQPASGDLAATAIGELLVGQSGGAERLADDADTRLDLDGWIADELAQVVAFGKGLIAPDGEPDGWVIDADVIPTFNRFHPASPDGACWVVLLLLASDHVNNDPDAQGLVRTILERYAGFAEDGIAPSRSPDGYFRHWIDPFTGQTKPGWSDELATYSTMKIAIAADRAAAFYPDDQAIRDAACAIIDGVTSWDEYIRASDDAVYLISNAGGGPLFGPTNGRFTEGILFVEQAAAYGGASSAAAFGRWMDRSLSPIAVYVTGRPVSGAWPGGFLASFITAYSALVQAPFRADPAWREHTRNLFLSQGAWTDDFGPALLTVFSAGTTKSEWGGYNADSLTNRPGNITTLSMLPAFSAFGDLDPIVGAYHAYRTGARQTFKTGASILYRRSDIDPAYDPNSAGLPDVAAGALALADILAPGFIDSVLALEPDPDVCLPPTPDCPGDITGDGNTDVVDFAGLAANFGDEGYPPFTEGDLDGDGDVDIFDFAILAADFGCGAG